MIRLAPVVGSEVYVKPVSERAVKQYGTVPVKARVVENYMGFPEAYRVRFPDGYEETFIGRFVDLTV